VTAFSTDQLARALDAHEHLLAGVGTDQWNAPTPCSDWTVRDLVNHVVGGNRLFAEILQGDKEALGRRRARLGRDHLGDDPVSAHRDSANELLEASRQPGVLERIVELPIGAVPGSTALQLRVVESVVHGWDLATATGQRVAFPDEIVEQALAFTISKLADLPPGLPAFGPPRAVADDAPAIDRLVACLGRTVTMDTHGAGA
jgi:uncharacterized protein (TIGR03086 family)